VKWFAAGRERSDAIQEGFGACLEVERRCFWRRLGEGPPGIGLSVSFSGHKKRSVPALKRLVLGVTEAFGGLLRFGAIMQVKDHPGVFAIGDIAVMTDGKTGEKLPGLGATALQAGYHAGETIKRLLEGKPPVAFKYVDKGTMAQIGRGAAVVELPTGETMTGPMAWLAWLGVHLALLSGTEEKISAFVDWGWGILTNKRGKRIILSDENMAA
jgi:NADH dehydrogenase FAD-containing subunit